MRAAIIRFLRRHPLLLQGARDLRVIILSCLPSGRPLDDGPAPTSWAKARRGIPVPRNLVYRNVPVVPARRFVFANTISDGGPVWPDFDANTTVRHQVHDRCVDRNAVAWRWSGRRLTGPFVWGGRCFHHFGHLAVEHMNRLPGALYHQPDAKAVFTLQPGKTVRDVPGYFWDMAAWMGLPRTQIHFVTRPFIAAELGVSPQTEHMSALPPPPWYLDLLEERARLNGLRPVPVTALYVHRLGQLAQGNGSIAGEGVVVDALRKAGVAVMDPAKEPLADQLSRYAGARLLVFAEGSALHGRQLLGRIDQDILVINRRPGGTMAWAQIGPRCRQLTFAEVGRAFLCPVGADGTQLLQHGVTLANPAQLIAKQGQAGAAS